MISQPTSSGTSAGLRAILLTIATVTGFAMMNAVNKYLTRDFPVPEVVWARFFFANIAILAFAATHPGGWRGLLRTKRPGLQAIRSVLMIASTLMFVGALSMLPLAEVEAISFAGPLFVVALSAPLLKERVPPSLWVAVAVGFLGVLIIIRPGLGVMSWAAALPLCVAMLYAAFQIATRRLGGADPPLTSLFYSGLLGVILTSAFAPFIWRWPDAQGWVLMAISGFLGAGSHFMLIKALELAPASLLQPFTYVQLVGAVIIGYVVFGNAPDLWTWIGALVIVASGLYVALRQRR
ncbi:MAG: DMT family transporter [Alphaproteobacteria bacterium]|nr:DMT family transporter [Alphaproteobacteria bacterium]